MYCRRAGVSSVTAGLEVGFAVGHGVGDGGGGATGITKLELWRVFVWHCAPRQLSAAALLPWPKGHQHLCAFVFPHEHSGQF